MQKSLTPRPLHHRTVTLLLFAATWCAAISTSARADVVADWNVIIVNTAAASGRTSPITNRIITMAHVAIHDALNAIDRHYKPYAFDAVAPYGASPEAAVAAAAYGVLIAELPNQKTAIDAVLASALVAIPDGKAKSDGLAIGQAAAAAILARRAGDGSSVVPSYTPGTGLGVWQPTPPAFGPAVNVGFTYITPFTLVSNTQFRPPAPAYFDLTSAEYAADYNEVKSIGSATSTTRTAEQSEIARFWYETSPGFHIRLARELVVTQKLNLWESARLFALLNIARMDALIASNSAKYTYNFWRPVTAIRAGANDGNSLTAGDPAWDTFLVTPSFPEYPSNHAIVNAAWAEVLARFFGTDQFSFTLASAAPFPGITRTFTSFSQTAQEASDSRIYAGIHFRTACTDGLEWGRKIGKQAFENFLQPAFDACLQDDRSGDFIQFNSLSGEYEFIHRGVDGFILRGRGEAERVGCLTTIGNSQVSIALNRCVIAPQNRGHAVVRKTPLGPFFVINDRDVTNSSCACR
ncbi:MAG: vanadium-dependent haloperoxidase [Blastocatellia bacterium]